MSKVPSKFLYPSDQIDPGSHLGKVLGGSWGYKLNKKVPDDPDDDPYGDSSSSDLDNLSQPSDRLSSSDFSEPMARHSSGAEEDGYYIMAN